jgi:hypothetical protein
MSFCICSTMLMAGIIEQGWIDDDDDEGDDDEDAVLELLFLSASTASHTPQVGCHRPSVSGAG